jgi:hypothetical protein
MWATSVIFLSAQSSLETGSQSVIVSGPCRGNFQAGND